MTNLVWSTEKPTVPGWYWHRYKLNKRTWREEILEILSYYQGSMRLWVTGHGDLEECNFAGEWAGPIPRPKEREG